MTSGYYIGQFSPRAKSSQLLKGSASVLWSSRVLLRCVESVLQGALTQGAADKGSAPQLLDHAAVHPCLSDSGFLCISFLICKTGVIMPAQ